MALDILLAQYPKQPVVRDRNFAGLVAWAASRTAAAVPADPPLEWVRERLVAERIPLQPANYVERTIAFFMQDPATVTNIREYLSPWNDEAAETSLSAQIGGVIAAFMPRFAMQDSTAAQLALWYRDHGLDPPAELPPPGPGFPARMS